MPPRSRLWPRFGSINYVLCYNLYKKVVLENNFYIIYHALCIKDNK